MGKNGGKSKEKENIFIVSGKLIKGYGIMVEMDIREYEKIIDFIDIQIWTLTDVDKYGIVNHTHATFLGKTKEELRNKRLDEILSSREALVCIASTKRVWDLKETVITREWIRNYKGEERVLKVIKKPQIGETGEVKYIICKAFDITKSVRRKTRQRISNLQYKSIVENHKDFICKFLPDTTLTYGNKAYCDYYGKTYEDLIGSKFLDLIPEDEQKGTMRNYDLINVNNPVISHEHKSICKGGNLSWKRWTEEAFFDDYGNIIEFQSVGVDITDLKVKEAFLDEKIKESEEVISNILEYDKLKTEFFANISHELRTPLNLILGTLQLIELKKKNISLMDKEHKILKQNSYRLIRLIDNLIDVTKIDAGYLELSLCNSNIVKVAEDITLSVVGFAENKGINVIFETNREEHYVAFDLDKLERILLNLLSNALKFTNEGGKIQVTVNVDQENTSILVEDDGIGIPKNKIDKVFDRFVQVDKTFKRNREGSGIGLALTSELIKMHGGNISVESEINNGSKFKFTIPNKRIENIENNNWDKCYNNSVERTYIEFSDIYS
ncbi:MAG: PAS domain-containing sensor histidine kinase [Anaeromicrobium sp.]|jgi:PAS domain S-box-containing protein|uniref:sensor histidine kinase n=1 Tax=Anaeromicrobium sp. TaxID=1929132 RepID=UPI0025CC1308|nr:PAS domain-containing sensor histidine kinase [Anaeromicrobium sp.]MCT4594729.1 PAS domain-containing sensor histidine kinase [Anaeromicrobium sp.]